LGSIFVVVIMYFISLKNLYIVVQNVSLDFELLTATLALYIGNNEFINTTISGLPH